LVGAEPGDLVEIEPLDLSVLQPRLAHYLGSSGAFWRHHCRCSPAWGRMRWARLL